jgi:integral membrane protein
MADFAGDPTTELERKLGPLKVVCIVETISYLALLGVWLGLHSDIGTKMVGSVHGMIFTAFALMILNIFRPMGWSWRFVAVAIGAGPIGAVIVYERLRRAGVGGAGAAAARAAARHR